jgi:multiple sugar transport system permease protein
MTRALKAKIFVKRVWHNLTHVRPGKLVVLFVLTAVALVSVLPIIYIVCNAFKPLNELFLYPPRFFVKNPTMQNFYDFIYATDVSTVPFTRYLFNSVVVTVSTVCLTLVFGATCAYAFSNEFKHLKCFL